TPLSGLSPLQKGEIPPPPPPPELRVDMGAEMTGTLEAIQEHELASPVVILGSPLLQSNLGERIGPPSQHDWPICPQDPAGGVVPGGCPTAKQVLLVVSQYSLELHSLALESQPKPIGARHWFLSESYLQPVRPLNGLVQQTCPAA
ncbi:MAG: hypothetical protein Q7S31_00045, partial [bacterium]|nr:hypothetical protein [bacterium]